MVYVGYCIFEDGEHFENIFKTTKILSFEEFVKNEESFIQWLEEKENIKDFEDYLGTVTEKEMDDYFIEYNENDDLGLYYSFENIDNVDQFKVEGLECEKIIELYKELKEHMKRKVLNHKEIERIEKILNI